MWGFIWPLYTAILPILCWAESTCHPEDNYMLGAPSKGGLGAAEKGLLSSSLGKQYLRYTEEQDIYILETAVLKKLRETWQASEEPPYLSE